MPSDRGVIVEQMRFSPTAGNKIFVNNLKMYIINLLYIVKYNYNVFLGACLVVQDRWLLIIFVFKRNIVVAHYTWIIIAKASKLLAK